ncbi:MAG: hypothetical protein Q8914_11250 [Bacteroidota bacterium]|nr:hypothetical protein [Bacteroidota bacterium]
MNFDDFYQDLEKELLSLAGKQFRKYRLAAKEDVLEYLRLSKGRIQDYTRLVQTGDLSEDEKAFLTGALQQNALLFSLKQSGRTQETLRRFAGSLVGVTLELALAFALKQLI